MEESKSSSSNHNGSRSRSRERDNGDSKFIKITNLADSVGESDVTSLLKGVDFGVRQISSLIFSQLWLKMVCARRSSSHWMQSTKH